jgi:hypothetical protein
LEKRNAFPLETVEKIAAQDKQTITCTLTGQWDIPIELQGSYEVNLDKLAPDITMADLANFKVTYEDIKFGQVIGTGGFGEVFKSTYKGETVAVKKLSTTLPLEDTVDLFREFRREVWVSRYDKYNYCQLYCVHFIASACFDMII